MQGLEQYDVKVLLALVKSISGRTDFFKWLLSAGYPELAAFSNAIRADDDAIVWLFTHDYAWLAILSNACDGDEKAKAWIGKALTPVNLMYALACRRDKAALKWLYDRHLDIFLMMAQETEKFLLYQEKEVAGPYVMHFGGHYRAAKLLEEWKQQQSEDNDKKRQPSNQGDPGNEESRLAK